MLEYHIESAKKIQEIDDAYESMMNHKFKADELVDDLRKEAEALSYISLEFVQSLILDFSSANYKKCNDTLNSLKSQFKKIEKLITSNDPKNYERRRFKILETCVNNVQNIVESLNLKIKVI